MTKHAAIDRLLSFLRGRSGGVAVLFALCIVPLIGIIGLVIDYGNALTYKARLNIAADAAALKAVTAAQAYTTAKMASAVAGPLAEQSGRNAFLANAGSAIDHVTGKQANVTVAIADGGGALTVTTITATVTYQAISPNAFAKIFNVNSMNVNGTAAASVTMRSYVNYYLLIDVSASMGLPATTTGQDSLAKINPDWSQKSDKDNNKDGKPDPHGCVFACHFTHKPLLNYKYGESIDHYQGYDLTRKGVSAGDYCHKDGAGGCIQLRVDAVAYAIQDLMNTAISTRSYTDQIGVGLYPFITHMKEHQKLTTDLDTVKKATAGIPDLLDTGTQKNPTDPQANPPASLGSGGTHFENVLTELSKLKDLTEKIGNGTSSDKPRPFVFLITDGAQDDQYMNGYINNAEQWDWNHPHPTRMDAKTCDKIKGLEASLYILYIPYLEIKDVPGLRTIDDQDKNANAIVNANGGDGFAANLTSCASPGGFFTGDTPEAINAAIQAMFAASLKSTRLIQ